MAEGTQSYEGLAVPLYGESEIQQQTLGTDIITITGATSQTGDFLVCQDVDGTEQFVVSCSGLITSATGLSMSSSMSGTQASFTVSATTMVGGISIVVSSTGALNALGTAETSVCGVIVAPSSKAKMNAAFAYAGGSTGTANTAITMLACFGANSAPSYFLAVSTTGTDQIYKGAHSGDQGFIDASMTLNTFTCDHPFIGLKALSGSQTFYLLAVHATGVT
jgi:hypothetical protein